MMMKLPHSEFRWLSSEELSQFDIDGFDAMGDYGVVLEVISQNLANKNQSKLMKRNQINLLLLSQVDLLYPDYLHDEHRDFPLAPEQLVITKNMLSQEMQAFLSSHGLRFSKQKRLTQTFLPKEGYVTHIKNLKFYKSEGVVITSIKRGIIFYQSTWMQEYIQINTLRRIDSRSKFEKDFFKLLVST
jgi:hypothetical protein